MMKSLRELTGTSVLGDRSGRTLNAVNKDVQFRLKFIDPDGGQEFTVHPDWASFQKERRVNLYFGRI